MQFIYTVIVNLLPALNTLTPCLIGFRVGIEICLFPLSHSLALAFITAKLLESLWDENLIAYETPAILVYLNGVLGLFKKELEAIP